MPENKKIGTIKAWLILLMAASLLSACTTGFDIKSLFSSTATAEPISTLANKSPMYAEVVFTVEIPESTPTGQVIYVNLLDEVTGLALNPLRYTMTMVDSTHYKVSIPLKAGSVIKYRYTRDGSPQPVEYTADGKQVRYRLFSIDGPSSINDVVCAWNDLAYSGELGRIIGKVTNQTTGEGVANILVTAAGAETLSAADGSFILEDLPTGVHEVVAYSMDGAYRIFQQGAVIANLSTTPVEISLTPAALVEVTFVVHPPENGIAGIPIRIVGNTTALGNTFADLEGGVSTIASRAPLLTLTDNNIYVIKLMLPEGFDLRYKYTLGDGFWNAEHAGDINFIVRQLIVPGENAIVQDTITSWNSGIADPVTFTVTTPATTPANEAVSIQFNPYGWTSPIPMWPLGNNQWMYILYSPLDMLGQVSYRICRNDQCGSADDVATAGKDAVSSQVFVMSSEPQELEYTVTAWVGQPESYEAAYSPEVQIAAREDKFFAGIELSTAYSPKWQGYYGQALDEVVYTGANHIILTPTWHYTKANLPVIEPVLGSDPSWADLLEITSWIQLRTPELVIYPQIDTADLTADWWTETARDSGWWSSWYERYHTFIMHHAILAEKTGASAIILGEPGMWFALPDGVLPDGTPSGAPPEAENFWRQLIADVRAEFEGEVIWAVPYTGDELITPVFLDEVDAVYLLWNTPLTTGDDTEAGYTAEFSNLLDTYVYPVISSLDKPLIIGLNYPSADGAATSCVASNNDCLDFSALDQPNPDIAEITLDVEEQADIYSAAFLSINDRPWVSGFISRGYYIPVPMFDKSSSIRQKPAEGVVKFWYYGILADQSQ